MWRVWKWELPVAFTRYKPSQSLVGEVLLQKMLHTCGKDKEENIARSHFRVVSVACQVLAKRVQRIWVYIIIKPQGL